MKAHYILIAMLFISVNLIHGQDSLFPQISGWKVEIEKQVYNPNNLWNIIDGAADLFLEYSFVDLHLARYTNEAGIEIKVELYKHSTPLTAFGMYSQEKDPDYQFLHVGAQGYIEPGALNFLTGAYYVKLSSNQNGAEVQNSLQSIAKKVTENLQRDDKLPNILHAFPEHGKQLNSEQYVAQNFLGYSFLKSAFTATYKNNSAFKIFIIENEKNEQAKVILDKFILTLPKENVVKTGEKYELNDPNNGMIAVVLQNKYLFGVVNCTDKSLEDDLLRVISNNLLRQQ
jgi:hypothetical protein